MGRILTDEQIAAVADAAFEILETVGCRVDNERALSLLAEAGGRVDRATSRVRLPRAVVERLVRTCPAHIRLGRQTGAVMEVGDGRPSVFLSGNALNLMEGDSLRPIDRAGLARLVRVLEGLAHVGGVVGTSLCDVPPGAMGVAAMKVLAENTTKHLRPVAFTADELDGFAAIADVLLDGRDYRDCPLYSVGFSVTSPLHWTAKALAVFERTSGKGIPVTVNGEPMAGGTSPVTLAGTLASATAEVLSGAAIVQCFEPGRPTFFNVGFAHVMDMRTAVALSAGPECALLQAAGADLARHFHMPSVSWVSSESMLADSQAAFEHTLLLMAHVQAGVSVIWGVGQLEAQRALAPELAVIDDEIIAAVARFTQGIEVNAESLAVSAIRDVAEHGGDFLTHDHTLAHFRDALAVGSLVNRERYAAWVDQGRLDLAHRAREKADHLAQTPPTHLSDPQRRELDRIESAFIRRAL
jgi:trimethylamine--corrinoid protein Co-methyltransferase